MASSTIIGPTQILMLWLRISLGQVLINPFILQSNPVPLSTFNKSCSVLNFNFLLHVLKYFFCFYLCTNTKLILSVGEKKQSGFFSTSLSDERKVVTLFSLDFVSNRECDLCTFCENIKTDCLQKRISLSYQLLTIIIVNSNPSTNGPRHHSILSIPFLFIEHTMWINQSVSANQNSIFFCSDESFCQCKSKVFFRSDITN